jgi:hypothetical protein
MVDNKIDEVLKSFFSLFSFSKFPDKTKANKGQQNSMRAESISPPLIIPPLSCQATQNFKRFSK